MGLARSLPGSTGARRGRAKVISDDQLYQEGYCAVRMLPSGVRIGVIPMLYTGALCVGISKFGYERRFCYGDLAEAVLALETWDGKGDPPGAWIKEKPSGRPGPGLAGLKLDGR
jgi:hypothetical protein